jgi:hypothetical protein
MKPVFDVGHRQWKVALLTMLVGTQLEPDEITEDFEHLEDRPFSVVGYHTFALTSSTVYVSLPSTETYEADSSLWTIITERRGKSLSE